MIVTDETLELLGLPVDRPTLETYIVHQWVKPVKSGDEWHFEAVDIARARLVHQLRHDFEIGDDAMDIVLSLIDQLYGMHERVRKIHYLLSNQPSPVRERLFSDENTGDSERP